MQLRQTLITAAAAFIAAAQAYDLRIYFENGLEVRVTGDMSTPCQDFPPDVKDQKITRVTYDPGSFTREFLLWSSIDCQGSLVQNRGAGAHEVSPPSVVGSFKIM